VLALAIQVVLARLMPAADLGLYFFATSLATVLAVLAAAGYPQGVARYLTRYRALARERMATAFLRCAKHDVAKLAIGLATAAIAVGYAASDLRTTIAVGVAATAIPLIALTLLFGAVANVRRQFLLASLPEFLLRPGGMLLAVAAMAWLGVVPTVPTLLSVFVVLCLGVTVIQAARLAPHQTPSVREGIVSRNRVRSWRASVYPLVTLSLFTALFADVATIAASPFLARGDLAVLAICLKISLLIGFVIQVVHQIVMPGVAEDLHRNRTGSAMSRVSDANRIIVIIILVATLVVALVGDRMLAVFEPTFAFAHLVLLILVVSQAVRALAGPASQILTIVGQQRYVIVACPVALALLVVSNAALIPHYGLIGAALAILLTLAAWSLALSCSLMRTAGLRSHYNPFATWRRAEPAA
jgi:O-antigen/teichoic acid export membrane protein